MSFQQILGQRPGFVFGGETGVSYEDLQRKRQAADQLRKGLSTAPTTAAGGLAAIGKGLLLRSVNRKADEQEQEGRQQFGSAFQQILSGGYGGPLPSPGRPAPSGETADTIRQGLTARGLPDHIADAFVLNFDDESGLNPGINEQAPTVPGSRGGFGLAQWTGPRREQLEAFASQRGAQVSNMDTQLDFLVHELQGSEADAAQAIFSAQDTGTAADAIVRRFLRPAEDHMERRSARYLGGAQQPQGGVDPQLAQLAASPWASPEQKSVLGMLLQQQVQQSDPTYRMQQRRAQMGLEMDQLKLEQLRNPQVDGVKVDDRLVNPQTGEVIYEPGPGAAGNGEYGLNPIYGRDSDGNVVVMQLGKDGQAVQSNLPDGITPDLAVKNFEGARGTVLGKAEGQATASAPSDYQASQNALDLIGSIRDDPNRERGTGVSAVFNSVPGTAGFDFHAKVEQAKSGAFLSAIQQLRGMGALSNAEGQAATAAVTRMNTSLSEDAFLEALADYEKIVQQAMDGAAARGGGPAPAPTIPAPGPAAGGNQNDGFAAFAADPSAAAAAEQFGVTLEEMWELKQGLRQ
ncbi:phage tail tip lysozyme [Leisingera sp. NJS204]|uniref:phage tail tip lysozyme n=1 Tax=Leisingera sp. NJS204 TaxID=2508307 RepID=UPI001011D024|nr:phage tail tip lysozyme [Leisingera sp. NJS204]QAX31316.1 hypothetical protein ETW24_19100 [Leisingera sp. NJS204]